MKRETKGVILALVTIFCILLSSVTLLEPFNNRTTSARFVLSSYTLDQYGQGFSGFDAEENSTGEWLDIQPYGGIPDDFNITYGMYLRFKVDTILNSSLVGASDLADGKNYFRHSISVIDNNGTSVFSQSNFTYFNSADVGGMYYYSYHIILNFLPLTGMIYRAILTYEVFYQ